MNTGIQEGPGKVGEAAITPDSPSDGAVCPGGGSPSAFVLGCGRDLAMQRVRTVFISDVHLGCKYGNASAFLDFINSVQPEQLYIVGDFIDGWRLKRRWHWNDTYSFILRRFVELLKAGTVIKYTPGNHDEFLRDFIYSLGSVEIADEFVHITADNRRLLVMHGDQFDTVVRNCRWLSMIGDVGYNLLLLLNKGLNLVRRHMGFGYWSLSAAIKRKVKQATNFISSFESVITRYAATKGCVGVVCGHIHTPAISEVKGIRYYNTGDWVESCTGLVEDYDGNLDLVYRASHYGRHRTRRAAVPNAGVVPVNMGSPLSEFVVDGPGDSSGEIPVLASPGVVSSGEVAARDR